MLITLDEGEKRSETHSIQVLPHQIRAYPPSNLEVTISEYDGGIWIDLNLPGMGSGTYNERPYVSLQEAQRDYECIVEETRRGNFCVRLYDKNRIELFLSPGD